MVFSLFVDREQEHHIVCALRDQSSSLDASLLVEEGGCTLRITRLYLRIGGVPLPVTSRMT